ncbi:DNA polymerase, beta domain protein region [Pyrobaculum calidifontis JCM 11548]|uniref:DNA polymerase, beta domain protein region n=1 Tax=Pyrobaculum calidifontis (strain DSM 21063 / JCM 11548 / VA1) TaxID=410359 RepID=A3MWA4_PYRCJ|nr:DNA polymerase, beta domain protein region [Pyrobaculum calidifontis JCM 11548]
MAEEKRRRAEELIKRLCERGGAVLLFGSRARGEAHLLSDWDLALIVAEGEYRVESTGVGQLFIVPLDKLDNILEFSMVVLDIFADGVLLCGDESLYKSALERFKRYVEEKRLVRTRLGVDPRVALRHSLSAARPATTSASCMSGTLCDGLATKRANLPMLTSPSSTTYRSASTLFISLRKACSRSFFAYVNDHILRGVMPHDFHVRLLADAHPL